MAVDGVGNLFVADTGNNAVEELSAADGYTSATTLGSGFTAPTVVSVDGSGNVFVADTHNGNSEVKEILAAGGYVTVNRLPANAAAPSNTQANVNGILYIADTANNRVQKQDQTTSPSLSFAAMMVGSTSSDSPQTVTITNAGDSGLIFPIPSTGNNASISSGFTLGNGTCPVLSPSASSAFTLAAGASCTYLVSFSPTTSGADSGSLAVTDNNLNAVLPVGTTQSLALSGSTSLTSQTISFPPISPVNFGVAPITLSATATSGLTVTYSVVSGPGTISGNTLTLTGVGTIVVAANQAGNANYAAATAAQQSLTVTPAVPNITIASSANSLLAQNSVTLVATVASTVGAPTGTVSFLDGSTVLGTATLSGGSASFTSSSLSAGAHNLVAVYSGDANFAAVTSGTLIETVEDVSLSLAGSSGASQTVTPGGTATYAFSVNPSGGSTFPAQVVFTINGLPSGATASFTPQSLPAGSPSTNVTMTVQTAQTTSRLDWVRRPRNPIAPMLWGLLLLPIAGRLRRAGKRFGHILGVLLFMVAGLSALSGLSGCAGSSSSSMKPQSYTLTFTAVSGALSHSTQVTLMVE